MLAKPHKTFARSKRNELKPFLPIAIAMYAGLAFQTWNRSENINWWLSSGLFVGIPLFLFLIHLGIRNLIPGDSIEVYMSEQIFRFFGFRFKTRFTPEPISPEISVSFDEVFGIKIESNKGRETGFTASTLKGRVFVSSSIDGYHEIKELIADCVEIVKGDKNRYTELVRDAPKLVTPWYGWVLLLALILLSFSAIYYFGLR